MDARDIIAWNVRDRRVQAGLSQEALADGAGISRSVISDIERSAVGVSVDMLDRLARYFGVETAELLRQPDLGSTPTKPLTPGRKRRT